MGGGGFSCWWQVRERRELTALAHTGYVQINYSSAERMGQWGRSAEGSGRTKKKINVREHESEIKVVKKTHQMRSRVHRFGYISQLDASEMFPQSFGQKRKRLKPVNTERTEIMGALPRLPSNRLVP